MEGPLKTIFTRGLITKKIILPINNIGKNIKQTIETYLKANYEGKCQIDGFIRPGSCLVTLVELYLKAIRFHLMLYLIVIFVFLLKEC